MIGTATVIRGNALHLPLPDNSVDLICTSPPYFGLRSYQDACTTCKGGALAGRPRNGYMKICEACDWTGNRKGSCLMCGARMKDMPQQPIKQTDCPDCGGTGSHHYAGQIGSEATPAEFLEALLAATREMVRVLKPSGSLFVNLGDKYSGATSGDRNNGFNERSGNSPGKRAQERSQVKGIAAAGMRPKTLIGIPWRYAINCIDQLGLILRAEIIWNKPNGLPESVTDRVRRSHEQWFHLTKQPRYFAAVDEIREPQDNFVLGARGPARKAAPESFDEAGFAHKKGGFNDYRTTNGIAYNPLGKLPGSVWSVPTQPLEVPPELGVDHFAAYPMEWPRRIIQGWTPIGICVACGEGRRPVAAADYTVTTADIGENSKRLNPAQGNHFAQRTWDRALRSTAITGYSCGCPTPTAPTRPAVCLDPFGGTGTTALVAKALGRHGITIDLSADYCRLAEWRCNNPQQLAAALQVEKPDVIPAGQLSLFEELL